MTRFGRRGSVRRSSVSAHESRKKGWSEPTNSSLTCWQYVSIWKVRELRLREWRRYPRKYRSLLTQVEDWSDSGEICHLLRDVLPAYWKKRVEDDQKRLAKKHMAEHIMSPEEQHRGIMEYF